MEPAQDKDQDYPSDSHSVDSGGDARSVSTLGIPRGLVNIAAKGAADARTSAVFAKSIGKLRGPRRACSVQAESSSVGGGSWDSDKPLASTSKQEDAPPTSPRPTRVMSAVPPVSGGFSIPTAPATAPAVSPTTSPAYAINRRTSLSTKSSARALGDFGVDSRISKARSRDVFIAESDEDADGGAQPQLQHGTIADGTTSEPEAAQKQLLVRDEREELNAVNESEPRASPESQTPAATAAAAVQSVSRETPQHEQQRQEQDGTWSDMIFGQKNRLWSYVSTADDPEQQKPLETGGWLGGWIPWSGGSNNLPSGGSGDGHNGDGDDGDDGDDIKKKKPSPDTISRTDTPPQPRDITTSAPPRTAATNRRSSWFPSLFRSETPPPVEEPDVVQQDEPAKPQRSEPIPIQRKQGSTDHDAPSSWTFTYGRKRPAAPSIEEPSTSADSQSKPPLKRQSSNIYQHKANFGQEQDTDSNLVLPKFKDTFFRPPRLRTEQGSGGLLGGLSSLWRSRGSDSNTVFQNGVPLSVPADSPYSAILAQLPRHYRVVSQTEQPPAAKIRRVVTVGIHGWFPSGIAKSILGEPTGTSLKFATMMHDAVQTYLEANDNASFNIQSIILESRGLVHERVERTYAQIMERQDWVDVLKQADAVFIAAHSQGTLVSTHVIARLLHDKILTGHKTHFLSMCGVSQGPFPYLSQSYIASPYIHYMENEAARELFQFQDRDSTVSKDLWASLQSLLMAGVKMTAVGSLNDQVVPLYSSVFSAVTHPLLLRAIYIDSDAFRTSDFLANLVVFALRLRNAGLEDHGLLSHVSEALAGALTGVGHSKLYEDLDVFTLAVRYQFETTNVFALGSKLSKLVSSVSSSPPKVSPLNRRYPSEALPTSHSAYSFNPKERRNPYLLTWALRGILEDPIVRSLFADELQQLRIAFDQWRPSTRVLKDVKLKLEGIRMMPYEGKL